MLQTSVRIVGAECRLDAAFGEGPARLQQFHVGGRGEHDIHRVLRDQGFDLGNEFRAAPVALRGAVHATAEAGGRMPPDMSASLASARMKVTLAILARENAADLFLVTCRRHCQSFPGV